MAQRIVIKGTSGAGKTTLGVELARAIELPFVELDALHHGPGWSAASPSELRAKVSAVLDDERGFVVDGNYDSKLGDLIVSRADLVIWLDLPLFLKLGRLVRRSARRWWTQERLWNGNRETLAGLLWGTESLFAWTLRTHCRHRREWPALFSGRNLVRLRSAEEVALFRSEFCARRRADAR